MGTPLPKDTYTSWSIVENVYVCKRCDHILFIDELNFYDKSLGVKVCYLEKAACGCCGITLISGNCKHGFADRLFKK
jgi:hypothetical protein